MHADLYIFVLKHNTYIMQCIQYIKKEHEHSRHKSRVQSDNTHIIILLLLFRLIIVRMMMMTVPSDGTNHERVIVLTNFKRLILITVRMKSNQEQILLFSFDDDAD